MGKDSSLAAQEEKIEGGSVAVVSWIWIFFVLLSFVVGAVCYALGAKAGDWQPVVGFFGIPVLMVCGLLVGMREDEEGLVRSASLVGGPTLLLLGGWLLISWADTRLGDVFLQVVRWGGVFVVAFVVLTCGLIARSLVLSQLPYMETEGWGEYFGRHPFSGLLYLSSTFIVTLLSFSLILAADDMLSIRNGGKGIVSAAQGTAIQEVSTQRSVGKLQVEDANSSGYSFLIELVKFPPGRDLFDFDREIFVDARGLKSNCSDGLLDPVAVENSCSLLRVIENIEEAQSTSGYAHVLLVGHADNQELTTTRYGSDYELSEARALQVQLRLLQAVEAGFGDLSLAGVEWSIFPVSNADVWLEDSAAPAPMSRSLASVEVGVVKVRGESEESVASGSLNNISVNRREVASMGAGFGGLMGYIYFAAYTFGTTGYGDFFPVSVFARSVVTAANILEVLFFGSIY